MASKNKNLSDIFNSQYNHLSNTGNDLEMKEHYEYQKKIAELEMRKNNTLMSMMRVEEKKKIFSSFNKGSSPVKLFTSTLPTHISGKPLSFYLNKHPENENNESSSTDLLLSVNIGTAARPLEIFFLLPREYITQCSYKQQEEIEKNLILLCAGVLEYDRVKENFNQHKYLVETSENSAFIVPSLAEFSVLTPNEIQEKMSWRKNAKNAEEFKTVPSYAPLSAEVPQLTEAAQKLARLIEETKIPIPAIALRNDKKSFYHYLGLEAALYKKNPKYRHFINYDLFVRELKNPIITAPQWSANLNHSFQNILNLPISDQNNIGFKADYHNAYQVYTSSLLAHNVIDLLEKELTNFATGMGELSKINSSEVRRGMLALYEKLNHFNETLKNNPSYQTISAEYLTTPTFQLKILQQISILVKGIIDFNMKYYDKSTRDYTKNFIELSHLYLSTLLASRALEPGLIDKDIEKNIRKVLSVLHKDLKSVQSLELFNPLQDLLKQHNITSGNKLSSELLNFKFLISSWNWLKKSLTITSVEEKKTNYQATNEPARPQVVIQNVNITALKDSLELYKNSMTELDVLKNPSTLLLKTEAERLIDLSSTLIDLCVANSTANSQVRSAIDTHMGDYVNNVISTIRFIDNNEGVLSNTQSAQNKSSFEEIKETVLEKFKEQTNALESQLHTLSGDIMKTALHPILKETSVNTVFLENKIGSLREKQNIETHVETQTVDFSAPKTLKMSK